MIARAAIAALALAAWPATAQVAPATTVRTPVPGTALPIGTRVNTALYIGREVAARDIGARPRTGTLWFRYNDDAVQIDTRRRVVLAVKRGVLG